MKILVAHDGSKYGKWAMEWVGRIPLALSAGHHRAPRYGHHIVAGALHHATGRRRQ